MIIKRLKHSWWSLYDWLTCSASRSFTVGNGVLVDILCSQAARSSTGSRYGWAARPRLPNDKSDNIRSALTPAFLAAFKRRHGGGFPDCNAHAYPGAARVSRGWERYTQKERENCVADARTGLCVCVAQSPALIHPDTHTHGRTDDAAQCFCSNCISRIWCDKIKHVFNAEEKHNTDCSSWPKRPQLIRQYLSVHESTLILSSTIFYNKPNVISTSPSSGWLLQCV